MRPLAPLMTVAALAVLTAGCTERPNGNAIPAKGLDPATVAKTGEPAPAETADAPAGRKVYDAQKCFKCHRTDDAAGPGKGKAPNLAHVGAKRSTDWIRDHIRNPKTHGGKMPAYPESKISDDDLKALTEYLASLK